MESCGGGGKAKMWVARKAKEWILPQSPDRTRTANALKIDFRLLASRAIKE